MIRDEITSRLMIIGWCLVAGLLFIQSCTEDKMIMGAKDRVVLEQDTMTVYTVKLTGVTLHPIEKEKTDQGYAFSWSDTLKNQIKFEAEPEYIILDSTQITKRSMEEKLSYKVVNPVESSSARPVFKFNKPVIFKDMTIHAGRNLMADSLLSDFVDFPTKLHPDGRGQLELNTDQFFIPPRHYMVKAAWQTTEGEVFTDSTRVFINMRQ